MLKVLMSFQISQQSQPPTAKLFDVLESQFIDSSVCHSITQISLEERPDVGMPVVVSLVFIDEILIHILQLPTGSFVTSAYSPFLIADTPLPSIDSSNQLPTIIRWLSETGQLNTVVNRTPEALVKAYYLAVKSQLQRPMTSASVIERTREIAKTFNLGSLLNQAIVSAELERQ
jgi:hypothetical protein